MLGVCVCTRLTLTLTHAVRPDDCAVAETGTCEVLTRQRAMGMREVQEIAFVHSQHAIVTRRSAALSLTVSAIARVMTSVCTRASSRVLTRTVHAT